MAKHYPGYYHTANGGLKAVNHYQLERLIPTITTHHQTSHYLTNDVPIISHYFWWAAIIIILCEWVIIIIPHITDIKRINIKHIMPIMLCIIFLDITETYADKQNSYIGYIPHHQNTDQHIIDNINKMVKHLNNISSLHLSVPDIVNMDTDISSYFLLIMPVIDDTITTAMQEKIITYSQYGGSILFLYDDDDKDNLENLAKKLALPIFSIINNDDVLMRSFYLLNKQHIEDTLQQKIWQAGFALRYIDNVPQFIAIDASILHDDAIFKQEITKKILTNIVMMTLAGQYKKDALHDAVIRQRAKRQHIQEKK